MTTDGMGPPHPVIYVRHGETDWNKQGLIQGSIDTPLNETGHAQAQAVAALLLSSGLPWHEFQVVVSPLKRAQQTARYIIEALGHNLHITDARVRELGFGVWEGKPFWELKDSPIYPPLPEDRFYWRPEAGESYEDGVARVSSWHREIDRPTLVVSHGAVGRCLIGAVTGLAPREIVETKTPQGAFCLLSNGTREWFDAMADRA